MGRGRVLSWLGLALVGLVVSAGCQKILGIHDSPVARTDAAGEAPEDRSGGTGGSEGDARDGSGGSSGGGGIPATSGSGGLAGGSGGSSGNGAGGRIGAGGADQIDAGAGGRGTTLDAQAPDAPGPDGGAGGAGPADAGLDARDASSSGGAGGRTGGTNGGAGSGGGGGAVGGSLACSQPWRANNVEARLLTPDTSGMTACSMAGSAVPMLAAAVDQANFRGAQACGACLRVQNAAGTASVVVPVVEKSGANGVLLTKAAMDQIMPGASLTMVSWSLVACDVQGQPVRYFIKEGSNAGYVGVQVRNARYPIATVSTVGSKAVALELQSYNYWESTAAGAGPLTLRLTDINGQAFQDSGIQIQPQVETTGQGQFPLCR